jgi:pseudaminic acid cytidylyltransferase
MRAAIIPARGGSKRIPRKNIRDFCGKPMISWSIDVAKASDCFDKIIVSTDDQEIADIARKLGAEVPFMRPPELSDDYTPTTPVIQHAVQWLNANERKVCYACCIYATAPFLSVKDLQTGWKLISESEYDYTFSVTSFAFPIQRAIRITQQGHLAMFNPAHLTTRSQDLEDAWHDAGQFYWGTAEAWCEDRAIFGGGAAPVKVPRYRVQDIDTFEDWTRAEWMFRAMQAKGGMQ